MTKKKCSACKEYLPISDFSLNKRMPDGLMHYCKPCYSKYRKQRYQKKAKEDLAGLRQELRERNIRRNYRGFTAAQYNEMQIAQGGVCAICKQPETRLLRGRVQPLSIGHCHKTHKIRALLCSSRNTAFGSMREDPDRIHALLEYAEKWKDS